MPLTPFFLFFFFNDTATTEIYTLSLHDALPICAEHERRHEIPECRPHDRGTRRQHARRHDGGDRVGGVVKAIDKIEDQGDEQNRQHEPDGGAHQACLIVMDSTTFATSSAWSSVPSRLS